MTRHDILLIDDNPNDVELALTALENCNAAERVTVAPGGPQAVALLRGMARLPSLVLLDLKMPQMDGLDVLDAIRADRRTHNLPVVMLTTSGEESDVQASYAHGANAYVVKPMDFSEFCETLRVIAAFWAGLNRRPSLN